MPDLLRVLGIDPGSTATGWGLLERGGGRLRHLGHGTLRAPRGAALPARLARLQQGLAALCAEHRPDLVVVERVFVAASPRAALVLGHARGVALAAAAAAGLGVREYAAAEIKQAVTGRGGAAKPEVQAMVQRLLGLGRPPARDAADALAAALCHLHGATLRERAPGGGTGPSRLPRSGASGRGRARRPAASRLVVRRAR